jgi:hypothetical protein
MNNLTDAEDVNLIHRRARYEEMTYSFYYDNYLMKYVEMLKHPKYSQEDRIKYNDTLLLWHENQQFSYMEEVNEGKQ